MIGIILAAGMASRLRPLTDTTPKCLLKVGDRCLLQRTIDAMLQNGIDEWVIVTGYRHNQIEDFVRSQYPSLKVHFILNDVYETTNNIYSLWLSRPYVEGKEALLMDSDILCDPKVLTAVIQAPTPNALAVNQHELGEEEMKVILDAKNYIEEISKTCSVAAAFGESVGIEKMSAAYTSALFKELDVMINGEKLENKFYELAFERLIPQGHNYYCVDTTSLFSIELDTVEDFNQAQQRIPEHLF